jgi:hypothetical protein
MKHFLGTVLFIATTLCCNSQTNRTKEPIQTFCNPVDISYRFCADQPSRREAADPLIIHFKDRYYLFASKSGGYWHSTDLVHWTFVETNQIPVEEYAPAVVELNDTLYFLASSNELSTIYKSGDPLSGKWTVAVDSLEIPVWDPAFFLDDDQKLYLYWGCSDKNPTYGVQVDYKNKFRFIGKPQALVKAHTEKYGWEVPGDYNTLVNQHPWIEGTWLTKNEGKYFLQYSGPGTEFKSYADGMYVSNNPLGPFTLQPHNPFAYKPEGFACGAGHGGSFTDLNKNRWQIGTITISQKHMFERRLGLYPVFFDSDDKTLHADTKYGDYPLIMPKTKVNSFDDLFAGWMLLSYHKKVTVSSSVDSLRPANMVDENIRTYWSAKTGNSGEYAFVDLGQKYDVYAFQINFAEHNTAIYGRKKGICHRYKTEYSTDGKNWLLLTDKSGNTDDNTHVYTQLKEKIKCRYLKITNIEVPGGTFALSGFRVFGKGYGAKPEKTEILSVKRNDSDRRKVQLTWKKSANATGYVINYGIDKNKLYQHYMVYGNANELTINSLNAEQPYFFSIEAFNENGITKSSNLK